MATIKLAEIGLDGHIGCVYDIDSALEDVGSEEYAELVPVVIFRHHELGHLGAKFGNVNLELAHIKTDLEDAVVGRL